MTRSRLTAASPDKPAQQSVLYDRSFALAILGQTCFVMANTLMTHYARWVSHLGGNVKDVGYVMGGGAIAGLVLRPWLGQWINRFGAINVWLSGYFVFAIGAIGNLLVYDLGWQVYVLRSLVVLGSAMVFASSLTYVVQSYPAERRTEAIGILGVGGFAGMLFGPHLGDLVLRNEVRARGDFVLLFVLASAAVIVPAFILLMLRKPDVRKVEGETTARDFFTTVARYWPGAIMIVCLVFGVSMTVPFGFLANFVDERDIRLSWISPIGLFFYCYAGWGLTLRLTLRRLPDQVGRRKVLLAGLGFMSAGMFSYIFVTPERPWLLAIPGLICGTGHALIFHTMSSLSMERFPPEVRGTGSALILMLMDIGAIAGAPLLGQIAATFGYTWLFISVGALCFLAGVLYGVSSVPVWRARSRASTALAEPPAAIETRPPETRISPAGCEEREWARHSEDA